jgi:hypothetical protein
MLQCNKLLANFPYAFILQCNNGNEEAEYGQQRAQHRNASQGTGQADIQASSEA